MTTKPAIPPPAHDGAGPLPFDRDELGRMVREAWVRWAEEIARNTIVTDQDIGHSMTGEMHTGASYMRKNIASAIAAERGGKG